MRLRFGLLLLSLSWLLGSGTSSAHLLNMSRSMIGIDEHGVVTVDLELDLLLSAGSRERYYALSTTLYPLASGEIQELLRELPQAVALRAGEETVDLRLTDVRFPEEAREVFLDPLSWPRTKLRLTGQAPAGSGQLRVSYLENFRFEEPIANTFVESASQRRQTRWLVTGQSSPVFALSGSTPQVEESGGSFAMFLDLTLAGVRHIFPDGIDHLLFVTALFLGSRSLRQLVAIVTLFTAAHSMSLAATTLGWVSAPSAYVEPLILLSIIWVALRGLITDTDSRERYLGVMFFGLIHGLGFAASLREFGLPPDHLLAALGGFNLGVEIAQLSVVGLLAILAMLLRRAGAPIEIWRRGGYIAVILGTLVLAAARFL